MCPRWGVPRGLEGRKLAIEAEAADWQPRCLWECGLLPAPCPQDCPPVPPCGADCGKPKQRRFPGNYLVYTDASAMRPKDPYLRKAACSFWAGDSKSDAAAWSLPGPVQTVYRAELFAILVALEIFRGDVEIVSDCTGVVDEAERIREGGAVSPTSRHADPWFRYKATLEAGGLGRVLVRWVPSHEKEDADRITPEDRNGNDQADKLANALAKRIGPTAKQGKLYDQRVRRMAAIQDGRPAQDPDGAPSLRPTQDAGSGPAKPGCGRRQRPRLGPPQGMPPPHPGTRRAAVCGAPTSLPHMARKATDASPVAEPRTTRGPGTHSSTCRAPAAVAQGGPPPMQAQAQVEQGK